MKFMESYEEQRATRETPTIIDKIKYYFCEVTMLFLVGFAVFGMLLIIAVILRNIYIALC